MEKINRELLEACKARLVCDEQHEQGTKEWHDAVLSADEQMKQAISNAESNKETDRVSLELAEIYRLNQLNAEMLSLVKDVAVMMEGDTGEWLPKAKALVEKVEGKRPADPQRVVIHVLGGLVQAVYTNVLGLQVDVYDLDEPSFMTPEEKKELEARTRELETAIETLNTAY